MHYNSYALQQLCTTGNYCTVHYYSSAPARLCTVSVSDCLSTCLHIGPFPLHVCTSARQIAWYPISLPAGPPSLLPPVASSVLSLPLSPSPPLLPLTIPLRSLYPIYSFYPILTPSIPSLLYFPSPLSLLSSLPLSRPLTSLPFPSAPSAPLRRTYPPTATKRETTYRLVEYITIQYPSNGKL